MKQYSVSHSSLFLIMAEFLCTLCGKIFSRKDSFQQHLSIHKQEPCECSDCGKVFKNKIQLSNHIPSHKRITCVGCNISIPLNTKRYHDCAKGTETETFKCDQCPYEAKQKQTLKRHTRVHNKKEKEIPLFNCIHCDKTFNRKDNMEAHVN